MYSYVIHIQKPTVLSYEPLLSLFFKINFWKNVINVSFVSYTIKR